MYLPSPCCAMGTVRGDGILMRYANLTNHPIIHHSPRGGSVFFRPGEARSESWWSRFVGDGPAGLTEVADDYVPSRDFKPTPPTDMRPVRSPSVIREQMPRTGCSGKCETSCQAACEASCELACESGKQVIKVFDHYVQVGADYQCRYCDWLTQDKSRIEPHLKAYHSEQMATAVKEPKKQEGPGPRQGVRPLPDPGVESPTIPSQDSPTSGLPARDGLPWETRGNELVCRKCLELGFEWKTSDVEEMEKHVRNRHREPAAVIGG